MFNCIKCENNNFKNLINGEWVGSKDNKVIEIYSPLDNSLIGTVPAMTKEDVDNVLSIAKEGQKKME